MKNEKLRVPKLRFKEFSGEWENKCFGDIYSFLQTNSFSRALLNYENGDIKNIHYGDIHTKFKSNFYIQDETVPYINQNIDLSKIKEENYCKEKDLVIADASEDYKDIGKAIELIDLNNEKLLAGLHTYIARDYKNKMALGFSGYFMQTYKVRVQMMKMATGISVLGISKGNLNKLELTIPQKQEQEKIASFLSSIDKKINQLSKKDKLLQNYKKAMMQKIFSQKFRFKKEDGSDYPEWEEKKLGDIALLTSSKRVYLADYTKKGIPFYRGKEISELKLGKVPDDILYISTEVYEEYKLKFGVPKIGDLLITAVGTLGNILKINDNKPFYFKDGNLIWFKDIQENSDFLEIVLEVFSKDIINTSIGSTQRALTMVALRKLKFNFPSLEEQTKIANFLSSLDTKISQNKKALEETQKFKKALLQKMFV